MSSRTIEVNYLARVEGEGALHLRIHGDQVEEARLKIFEPPRFFEALLRGRDFREAPDITQRICGICPVAYLMSACHALEGICGVQVDGPLRELRRLLYCGEWIQSHALHVFMLHAPDFLGYQDAVQMAKDHPELVENALRLKKLGNAIMTALGGREIHPINVKVGGFYKTPRRSALLALLDELRWALDAAPTMAQQLSAFEFPEFAQDYEFASLRHDDEYPFNEGRLVSNRGLDVPVSEYDQVFVQHQVEHSTALHTRVAGRGLVHLGPLARYALNYAKLHPQARDVAQRAGLGEVCRNPFQSIVVRFVEIVYALAEAVRVIEAYREPDAPALVVEPRAGTGYGATEAPRGICYQRYTIDDDGSISASKIVAPTSVNQAVIERDLFAFASERTQLSDEALQWQCEQAIRNYDPCISCACHFLRLTVERT
ncbi:MAG: nickel-dependent hydrogenase large subunit [Myxococcales bacterium]|nr:nickel-dependent hydrogenase large subunit [Myxococcales bacterium]MDD9967361.1 nickel-dependent hydrogenase large subunit [Myxococcales bacterium]